MKDKTRDIQIIMHYLGAAEFRKQLRTAAMDAACEYEELKNDNDLDADEDHALLAQILDEANEQYDGVYPSEGNR